MAAADEGAERTEEPTPRRRSEARREGQVPRSADLSAAVTLLGGLLLLRWLGGGVFERLLSVTREIGDASYVRLDGLSTWLMRAMHSAMWALLPFLLSLMLLAAVAGLLQTGLLVTWKRLKPKFDHLNPAKGLKRIFSLESLQRLGMGLLKMAFVVLAAWWTIAGQVQSVIGSATLETGGIFAMAVELVFTLGLRLGVLLLIVGLLDFLYQRYRTERGLKMTKQEVKDEMKNMEGDPQVRQRRRQVQLRLAMQRMQIDVPKASVVVTNPTHYAVALRYDEGSMAAPRVVAKGQDLLALRIRQIAEQHGVPVVQRPPLARALHAAVEVGQEIPPHFYRAVAEILAYVHRLARGATA